MVVVWGQTQRMLLTILSNYQNNEIFSATARCDGDQLAVGACGSGFNNDCPDGTFTLLECCRVAEFYYGTCEVRGGTWGELLACPDIHTGDGHLLEGLCESGTSEACNGHASEVECCQGHYQGQLVGSTGQCSWVFSGGFGALLGRKFASCHPLQL